MSSRPSVDVVVVADHHTPRFVRLLERLLVDSSANLQGLTVMAGPGLHPSHHEAVAALAEQDSRVVVHDAHSDRGPREAEGLVLTGCETDLVLLDGNALAAGDWLDELAEVAYSSPRTACASPLTDDDSPCSIRPRYVFRGQRRFDEHSVRAACIGLPPWTIVPMVSSFCCYMRKEALDAVGSLDTRCQEGRGTLIDWVARAQNLGFVAKRANHVYVGHRAEADRAGSPGRLLEDSPPLNPDSQEQVQSQVDRFSGTIDRTVVSHAVELVSSRKISVAFDLRHLPREQVGTRTYAVSLLRAMERMPDANLTLLVRYPSQADGFKQRVVTECEWKDDVAVIHRPAQIIDVSHLQLLYESSAHLVITYQDLIGYRIPAVFPSDDDHLTYRATSYLSLQGMQRIIAYSQCAADEITEEFGIPREEVVVTPLGVDDKWFTQRDQGNVTSERPKDLPRRFFLSVATDYPHKNLVGLLEAYEIFRRRWRSGEPPALVMAGYTTAPRSGFYQSLKSVPPSDGIRFLGPVSAEQLRYLYQNAEAMIFPSLYEGFGLPPLEAMAAGTPVIAMHFSSVPEVGGDSILYPDGLSARALANVMGRLASDEGLQEELRARGLERVLAFRWENTARKTLDVYRSAVLRPSARSLDARRRLRDAILTWSDPVSGQARGRHGLSSNPGLGIRHAWKALNVAVQRRLSREFGRITPGSGRRSA